MQAGELLRDFGVFGLNFGFFDLGGGALGGLFGGRSALVFAGGTGGGAGFKLIYAAFDVQDALFAGKEGVRGAGDVDLNQRVFVAVFPLGGFFGGHGGARQKAKTVIEIFEHNVPVIVGVQTLFHRNFIIHIC